MAAGSEQVRLRESFAKLLSLSQETQDAAGTSHVHDQSVGGGVFQEFHKYLFRPHSKLNLLSSLQNETKQFSHPLARHN